MVRRVLPKEKKGKKREKEHVFRRRKEGVRDTQRGTQNYMEKRRGRREIEVIRRRGESKGEQASQ